ncbi:transcriptional regulator [Streptomyces sp. NBC_01803]|uniref:transcriptional regulator n=1 Tax=Streptomyces sp. NBC_01803 TaxID=2975946 RepID=UPI002DDC2F03|nr:helix-turn-helix domain-containing protein [Streptomyces sp. NBC_01803]WSA46920.1 helix-turn-helix domain-containing protein [Streptomyces sp. NBC_01803]
MTGKAPAEDFAERLRELKERSGLSFGVLAGRLHMGTSTLHRYCSGAVVPADYAPVERLARLCGADRDELLALHRLWLRADATRPATGPGRGPAAAASGAGGGLRGPGTAGEPEPEPRPEPAFRSEPGVRVTDPETRDGSWDGSWDGPWDGPGSGHEPAPGPEPGPEPGPGRRSGTGPGAQSPGVAGPGPGSADEPGFPGAGSGRRSASKAAGQPGGRRRRWWSGGVAVAASLVLVVLAVNAVTSDGAADQPPDVDEDVAPLTWTADSQVWEEGCGHRYLVDGDPGDVPAPPVAQDAAPWARRLGAVHESSTIVETTVRPTRPVAGPVVVEAVHIRVTERRAPLDWPVFDMSPGCGGALTPAAFTVDLDADRPVARPKEGYDGVTSTELVAPTLPFAVTADDPLVLRVEADAGTCDCAWYIELAWSVGGERGTVRVDDGGEPFRTSGGGDGADAPHVFAMDTESWRRE